MYPIAPVTAIGPDLVRTGLPVASLLLAATVLVITGLLLVRAGAAARRRPDEVGS